MMGILRLRVAVPPLTRRAYFTHNPSGLQISDAELRSKIDRFFGMNLQVLNAEHLNCYGLRKILPSKHVHAVTAGSAQTTQRIHINSFMGSKFHTAHVDSLIFDGPATPTHMNTGVGTLSIGLINQYLAPNSTGGARTEHCNEGVVYEMTNILKIRRKKMNHHKYKKWRKKTRALRERNNGKVGK